MAGNVPTSDRNWRRWSLAGFGPVLVASLLVINTAKPEPLFANPIDLAYPLVLALGVTGAGLTVAHKDYSPEEIWSLTRWTGVVTVVFAALSLWGVFLVLRAGGLVTLAINIVTAAIATGAGIGIILGEYDRRRRQESARAETVETAVENAMDGVALLNADEEYVMVNQAHADLYGYDGPEAMVGETWRMCYEPETVDEFEDEIMPTLSEAGVWRGEAEGVRADGTTFPQELSLTTLADGGIICVVRDISERVEREQELTSTTNLLSTLVGNIPAGILAEDSDRRMLFTNQAFCDIFGIEAPPEELVGSDCEAAADRIKDLFVESERFIERTNQSVITETRIEREEYDLVDGRTLERSAIPVELDGEETGHLWVYHDVTERTQYERRLNALHETTRKLMTATSRETIATHASDAANNILELPLNGIHLYDDAEEGLVPVAWSSETEALVGKPPTFTPGDGVAWQTFETGEARVFDDVSASDEVYNPETPIKSELHLPLGEHGVFLVGETTPEAFDQTDVTLAKLLATNVETALDRADREQSLRDREAQLVQERDRFATLFEHIPDPAVTVDLDADESVTQSVNQAFQDVFGYTEAEAVGTSLNDLIVPDEFEQEAERIDERALADEQLIQEVRRQTADGEVRDFLFRNVPIGSETGEAYGIYTDITERKRRERTFEALNEVTRSQIQASTPSQICDLAVGAARDVLNLPLSGIHLIDETEQALQPIAVEPEVAERLDESELSFDDPNTVIWEAFDTGEIRVLQDFQEIPDERLPDPDTPVQSAVVLPLGTHGVLIIAAKESYAFDEDDIHLAELLATTTATALDRTAQERTLERLHEATRELMSVSDEQAIADLTLEAASTVLGFSLVSVRYLDTDENALVPVTITDEGRETLGEPEVFHDGESLAWDPLETGEPRIVEDVTEYGTSVNAGTGVRSLLILPLGEYGTLNIASTTVDAFDETDVSLAQILAANVETALDRADDERELRERERELRQQNEQLEEFASVLSHDLRNPLNVATGRLEFIEGEEHEEHLEAIRRAHERMDALIEDVLTLARQGQTVGETTVIPVQRTVTQAWRQVDTGTATIDADIDLEIEADESRLQQLFENLFRNAIEHGGDGVTVRVATLADGTGFYVADDGPGIPSDEREKIFDHGYSTAAEGTGFGLAIVQQVVRAHNWTIAVAESIEGGARFEIRGVTPVGDRND